MNGPSFLSWPIKDLATVGAHQQVLYAILQNFCGTIPSLKEIGFALTKSDLEMQMPSLTRTGLVDINIASLDDELMGGKDWTFL